jgi:hypothetical protein
MSDWTSDTPAAGHWFGKSDPMPQFIWYGGACQVMSLTGTGDLMIAGALTQGGSPADSGNVGVTEGSDAAPGMVGEFMSSEVGSAVPIAIASRAPVTITSFTLSWGLGGVRQRSSCYERRPNCSRSSNQSGTCRHARYRSWSFDSGAELHRCGQFDRGQQLLSPREGILLNDRRHRNLDPFRPRPSPGEHCRVRRHRRAGEATV